MVQIIKGILKLQMLVQHEWCICLCVFALFVALLGCIALKRRRCPEKPQLFGGAHQRLRGYIIHLSDRTDRDSNVHALLANARAGGVDLTVTAAVDGRACEACDVHPFMDFSHAPGHWRKHLRGGEQGCLASYLKVFDTFKDVHPEGCFFVEDDAIVPQRTFQDLATALETHRDQSLLLHGRRAYPSGWTNRMAIEAEDETAGQHMPPA